MKADPVFRVSPYLNNKLQGVICNITRAILKLKKRLRSPEIDGVIKELEYANQKVVDLSRRTTSFMWKLKTRKTRKNS